MKKNRQELKACSHIDIKEDEIVNRHREEADRIENDPAAMLALADILIGYRDRPQLPS